MSLWRDAASVGVWVWASCLHLWGKESVSRVAHQAPLPPEPRAAWPVRPSPGSLLPASPAPQTAGKPRQTGPPVLAAPSGTSHRSGLQSLQAAVAVGAPCGTSRGLLPPPFSSFTSVLPFESFPHPLPLQPAPGKPQPPPRPWALLHFPSNLSSPDPHPHTAPATWRK